MSITHIDGAESSSEFSGLDAAWTNRSLGHFGDAVALSVKSATYGAVFLAVTGLLSPTARAADASATREVFQPSARGAILAIQFREAYDEMESYRELRDGWDGIGSKGPLTCVIDDAQRFLASLPSDIISPEATASADGIVGWFWKTDGLFASVAFTGDGRVVYFARRRGGGTARGQYKIGNASTPDDLISLVRTA